MYGSLGAALRLHGQGGLTLLRATFTLLLAVVVAGLAYFIAVGLMQR